MDRSSRYPRPIGYVPQQRGVFAVNRASFHLDQGTPLGSGESGSGKSTLAMAVLRLLPARIARVEGKVLFRRVSSPHPKKR